MQVSFETIMILMSITVHTIIVLHAVASIKKKIK